jgi:hypothetical protein
MEIIMTTNRLLFRVLSRLLPLLILAFAVSGTIAQTDPPARVGSLSHIDGSVALAPAGDAEWTDAVPNRPVTRGDRLWTDRGARAELHLGSAVLHLDGETFLDVTALDDQVLQASLNEGSVNARVRELDAGENFEIDTPNLAFRASQPGDYRIDVDPARGTTRVTVRSGIALVYGAGGEAQQLQPGQQITFAGRDLERVAVQASPVDDGFDRWAADRNRREDESVAARYIPREVVGYQQLDAYGSWAQDPTYGAVWFPRTTVVDWAPYRHGHWEWISPWGWTWIDDAPWGFAPFHYGRWAMIGSRWCWVPGRIGPRPIYSPALVVFLGGGRSGSSWSLSIGSGPGIAWYPLAPGEAWRPTYRASPVYVRNVNRNIFASNQSFESHVHRRRAEAVTALKVDDFRRGRPVNSHWTRVNPAQVARAPVATLPSMPEPRRFGDAGRTAQRVQPPARTTPPVTIGRPQPNFATPRPESIERGARNRPAFRPREDIRAQEPRRRLEEQRPPVVDPRRQERPPQVRGDERQRGEQRAQDEQRRQQAQQMQRARREQAQQVQQERAQRELQVQRQQEEQRRAQQGQLQREQALRQKQAAQEQRVQQQREQALRQQQAAQERGQQQQQRQQREQALRQQQAAQDRVQQQREQALRQQQAVQERQQQQQQQQQLQRRPQVVAPAAVRPGPPQRGEARERAAERGRDVQERRSERRSQGDDDRRGRGQGQGRGG